MGAGLHYGGDFYGTAGQLLYTWNDNSELTYGFFSGLSIPDSQWSFVAAAIEPTKATLYVYNTTSQASAENPIPHASEAWAGNGTIGGDPESNVARTFNGKIDEVAVFNRTLSPAEIQDLYNAGSRVTLRIERSGPHVILTWPYGILLEANDLAGPWTTNNATSPYTNVPTASKKFYKTVQ